MAFHFNKKESPTRATRSLSRERIGRALDCLQKPDRLAAVHRVRKEIKKIRATLELVHDRMEGDVYRKCTKMLRAVAKRLQDPRDAHVRPRTLERLVARFKGRLPARSFSEIRKCLRRNCREETREFVKGKSLAVVGRRLRKLNLRAGDLKVKAEGWTALDRVWRKVIAADKSHWRWCFRRHRRKIFINGGNMCRTSGITCVCSAPSSRNACVRRGGDENAEPVSGRRS